MISILVLLSGASWIWLSRTPSGSTSVGAGPIPKKGFLAPDFTLSTATDETISLIAQRGNPVIVNLWASWCAPCRAEMPAFQKVYDEYHSKGLEILAVNVTTQDRPASALSFAEEFGLSFPILLDRKGSISNIYQTGALPTTYLIDKHGIIREVVIGGPISEALLRIRVEELLNEQ